MNRIKLPVGNGGFEDYPVGEPGVFAKPSRAFTRKALGAAHVVADPLSTKEPWLEAAIDWDATIAYRRHLCLTASAWLRPWTPRSAAWASTGRMPLS